MDGAADWLQSAEVAGSNPAGCWCFAQAYTKIAALDTASQTHFKEVYTSLSLSFRSFIIATFISFPQKPNSSE